MRDLSYEEALRERSGDIDMEQVQQFVNSTKAARAAIEQATAAFEYLPVWFEAMAGIFRGEAIATLRRFRRAAIRHGHITANPRTRYQPCARYSRHPRYQPKHPDEPHANTSTSNVAPTVLPPATSAEK